MSKYLYGILAGLWIAIGYAFLLSSAVQSLGASNAVAALMVIGGGVILSFSARNVTNKNMLVTIILTAIGWGSLSLGVGNYFLPIFGNVGGTLPGQFLYFILGVFLLPILLLSYVVAIIIHKIKFRKESPSYILNLHKD